ncbi:sn-glycerol-1-phosphate dehydrogenase [Christensenella tenuis]|uniref:Sn-glycerol-1-phosphate dehydrogenase n=1 Tax=Christensenella tenuis TaxID=2763033 RepID=A0ABR7ECA9_9FIRM|nr:sn-glycerol-1-phosphate dehydrogenase [Christensenella tenuis]MBC5647371.1 sn-glycerol-1-phosphate dehydrogenase [Christensenella tenuis]
MFEDILDVTDCACGKNHTLKTRDYIVEKDAMLKLPALLGRLFPDAAPLAVFDRNTYEAAHPKFNAALPGVPAFILTDEEIHADEKQVGLVTQALREGSCDLLLAVGSGVICDIVRYVAFQQDIPFIAVPTAASVDGFVSDSAAMTLGGAKITLPAKAPNAVVADLEIIAAAPKKMTASGVGDMLSKYISIADWKIGHLITGEYFCPFVADLTIEAVDMIVQNIEKIDSGDIESFGVLMKGLLLSGITMQMVGITRPASSFEHHFSHYLETVPIEGVNRAALHGEKVGIATIQAAKYYPVFTRRLKRIYEQNIPNQFDIARVKGYYAHYPENIVAAVEKENTPTITSKLDRELLKQNYDEVLRIADEVPSPGSLTETLRTVGGYTDYSAIDMTDGQFRETMKICCYIRNRFTMLRLMCDFELFDFDTELEF